MRTGADTESHRLYSQSLVKSSGPMQKMDLDNDPRLVPMARLLRAGGLDELPQVINVLKGEMSLVGPRPCIPYEYEAYEPRHCRRFEAVPGLTGLWQVNGKNRTSFEQMIDFDIRYAENLSFWLDLKIIFKTVPALWDQCSQLRAGKSQTSSSGVSQLARVLQP
jgi:exopolysaccharide production protein ExoY